jgi:hypothetical protein
MASKLKLIEDVADIVPAPTLPSARVDGVNFVNFVGILAGLVAQGLAEIEHCRADRDGKEDDADDGEPDLPLARVPVHPPDQALHLALARRGFAADSRFAGRRLQVHGLTGRLLLSDHAQEDKGACLLWS